MKSLERVRLRISAMMHLWYIIERGAAENLNLAIIFHEDRE